MASVETCGWVSHTISNDVEIYKIIVGSVYFNGKKCFSRVSVGDLSGSSVGLAIMPGSLAAATFMAFFEATYLLYPQHMVYQDVCSIFNAYSSMVVSNGVGRCPQFTSSVPHNWG